MTMSMSNQNEVDEEEKLGVLELCSALNGDDSLFALRTLRKFVKTVRRERFEALLFQSNGEDSKCMESMEMEMDDDETNIMQENKKELEVEEWKLDTKSYNVPFVGTKIPKGDTGIVVPCQWPTGLLLAYLKTSPHAVEFTGTAQSLISNAASGEIYATNTSTKSSKNFMNLKIYATYLQALLEIITVAIPKTNLLSIMAENGNQKVTTINSPHETEFASSQAEIIVTIIMKDHFQTFLQRLSAQINQSNSRKAESRKNIQSHCGPLTSTLLKIFTYLSYTSTKNARQIARGLISLKDNVLPATLKQPISKHKKIFNVLKNQNCEIRSSCISLATALLQTNDTQTLNIILSPGSKVAHSKSCAGLVLLVFRTAMTDRALDHNLIHLFTTSDETNDNKNTNQDFKERQMEMNNFFKSLATFLKTFCKIVLYKSTSGDEITTFDTTNEVSNRLKAGVFGGDVMNRLIRLVEFSPSITSAETIPAILSREDTYDTSENNQINLVREAAVQSRRLLFSLLSDVENSPFLIHIRLSTRTENTARNYLQKIARSLIALSSTTPTINLGMRALILLCMKRTPELMQVYFNLLTTTTDPIPSFHCISSFSHLTHLIKEGPTVMQCLDKAKSSKTLKLDDIKSINVTTIISCIIPKSLMKSTISKAIQHQNPLLLSEFLKFIISMLQRSLTFIHNLHELNSSSKTSQLESKDKIALQEILIRFMNALSNRLPDMQSFLAIRSKFDSSSKKIKTEMASKSKTASIQSYSTSSSIIIMMQLYEILRLYKECLPQVFHSVKFEWTKLIPDNEDSFFALHPVVQYRCLTTLKNLVSPPHFNLNEQDSFTTNIRFTAKTFISLLTIVISTKSDKVRKIAKEITNLIIVGQTNIRTSSNHTLDCLKYEANQWIDFASKDILPEIAKMFDSTQRYPIQHTIVAAQAWSKFFPKRSLPVLCFSPLLTMSLVTLSSSSSLVPSKAFSSYVQSIAIKLILFQLDPLPLASLITHCSTLKLDDRLDMSIDTKEELDESTNLENHSLVKYAQAIIKLKGNRNNTVDWDDLLESMNHLLDDIDGMQNQILRLAIFSYNENSSMEKYETVAPIVKKVISYVIQADKMDDEILCILCQLLHHQSVLQAETQKNEEIFITDQFLIITRLILVKALQNRNTSMKKSALEVIFKVYGQSLTSETGSLLSLVLSSPLCEDEETQKFFVIKDCLSQISSYISEALNNSMIDNLESLQKKGFLAPMILTTLLIRKNIPLGYKNAVLHALLRVCAFTNWSAYHSNWRSFFFAFLIELLHDSSIPFESEPSYTFDDIKSSMDSVFNLWMTILTAKTKKDRLDLCLIQKLEKIMSRALTHSAHFGRSSYSLFSIAEEKPEKVVELCLSSMAMVTETKTTDDSSDHSNNAFGNLLSAFIEYDYRKLIPPLMTFLNKESDSLCGKHDRLDYVLTTYVIQMKENETLYNLESHSNNEDIMCGFCERVYLHLKENVRNHTASDQSLSKKYCEALIIIFESNLISDDFKSAVIEKFSDLIKSIIDKVVRKPQVEYEGLMILTLTSILCQDTKGISFSKMLRSLLFRRLCMLLPGSLKGYNNRKQDAPNSKKSRLSPFTILVSLFNIGISKPDLFDRKTILDSSNDIQRTVIICLKNGIANDNRNKISSVCLRLVRIFIVALSEPNTLFANIINVAQIHMMIVTHSSFQATLTLKTNQNDDSIQQETDIHNIYTKNDSYFTRNWGLKSLEWYKIKAINLELTNLLISCVSMAQENIDIDDSTSERVLLAYNAGVDEMDCALRRLLYLYDKIVTKKGNSQQQIFTDKIRWGLNGSPDSTIANDHGQNWDWILKSLDFERIRSTLEQFPIWDTLIPHADLEVEPWGTQSKLSEENHDDLGSFEEDEDEDEDEDMNIDKSNKNKSPSVIVQSSHQKMTHRDEWRGSGVDNRYSPAFILPLVVSILVAFYPPLGLEKFTNASCDGEESMNDPDSLSKENPLDALSDSDIFGKSNENNNAANDSFEYNEQRAVYAEICHSLCEKGIAALVLASLSSVDPNVRQLAAAAVGLLLKGIYSKEAHDIYMWKERPQLQMVFDSIQRGLALRRELTKAKTVDKVNFSDSGVPRVPPVSAIFLAKASLIIADQTHDMYGSINSFFLKLSENHGAYRDTGSLPAFISMFCSSNDRPDHARKEKLWALSLLKDGVIDTYDYIILLRRHVPALLLTSFDTDARRKEKTNVYDMEQILDVVRIMIENGGKIAYNHFVQKVGLISWMKSLLVTSRDWMSSFPSLTIRWKFLQLLTKVMESCSRHVLESNEETKDYIGLEAYYLITPVFDFFVDTYHSPLMMKTDTESKRKKSLPMVFFCDTICSLKLAAKLLSKDAQFGNNASDFSFHGIDFGSVQKVLSLFWDSSDLLMKIIDVLVFFPFHLKRKDNDIDVDIDVDIERAKSICKMLLNALVENSISECNFFECAMNRIKAIFLYFREEINKDDELIELILSLRKKSLCIKNGITVWEDCKNELMPNESMEVIPINNEIVDTFSQTESERRKRKQVDCVQSSRKKIS